MSKILGICVVFEKGARNRSKKSASSDQTQENCARLPKPRSQCGRPCKAARIRSCKAAASPFSTHNKTLTCKSCTLLSVFVSARPETCEAEAQLCCSRTLMILKNFYVVVNPFPECLRLCPVQPAGGNLSTSRLLCYFQRVLVSFSSLLDQLLRKIPVVQYMISVGSYRLKSCSLAINANG